MVNLIVLFGDSWGGCDQTDTPPKPPDISGGSISPVSQVEEEPSLEKVFGKGATMLAITMEENSKGKRVREEKGNSDDDISGVSIDVKSVSPLEPKKQKLGSGSEVTEGAFVVDISEQEETLVDKHLSDEKEPSALPGDN